MDALILNSAQGKYPIASEPWVLNTISAIGFAHNAGYSLLVSQHPIPWDFVSWRAAVEGITVTYLLPEDGQAVSGHSTEKIFDDYGFDPGLFTLSVIDGLSGKRSKQDWQIRDCYAVKHAGLVIPVSIRPGGRLEGLLNGCAADRHICNDFRTEWEPVKHPGEYSFDTKTASPPPDSDWIFHWTRASQGPWPGERRREFFNDFCARPNGYVRSALDTLKRILSSGTILGSSSHMPGGMRAVSCTSLTPEEALPLMRWRQRYSRYTFEPYGIGIRRDAFVSHGGREVLYRERKDVSSDHDPLFIQSPGSITDWSSEHEWRIAGDINLGQFDRDDIIVAVPDFRDRERIEATGCGYRIHCLFKG